MSSLTIPLVVTMLRVITPALHITKKKDVEDEDEQMIIRV